MVHNKSKLQKYKRGFLQLTGILIFLNVSLAFAASGQTIGNMASSITETFMSITRLITAASYVAGLGFMFTSLAKFKQHKDNPTQIPIGTPVSLVLIAAALLFMPSILSVASYTMFGTSGGTVAGPSGTIIESSNSGS